MFVNNDDKEGKKDAHYELKLTGNRVKYRNDRTETNWMDIM